MHIILIILLVLVTLQIRKSQQKNFSFYWFLFNGYIIHIYLDGIVGLLQGHDYLFQKYSELDLRYPLREPTVMIISTIELLFMGPTCIFVAYLYQTNYILLRNFIQALISIVQLMGTIIFTTDEILRDFKDVCQEGCYTLTIKNIIYFWIFFVIANPVWVIIPVLEILKAYNNLSKLKHN